MLILFAGILALGGRYTPYYDETRIRLPAFLTILVLMALLPLGGLMLSAGFRNTWSPLVGEMAPVGVPDAAAMLVMFLVDLVGVTLLVAGTGGSAESPFQAVYFLLPTLALFLREPPGRVFLYAGLSLISFTVLMVTGTDESRYPSNRFAFWIVSVGCLVLTLYIGLATRIK